MASLISLLTSPYGPKEGATVNGITMPSLAIYEEEAQRKREAEQRKAEAKKTRKPRLIELLEEPEDADKFLRE